MMLELGIIVVDDIGAGEELGVGVIVATGG